MTGATAAAAAGAATAGGVATFAGDVFLVAAFEVGFVPAATFQAKAGRGDFLFQLGFVTGRADHQRLRTQFLQGFMFVTASIALVFVDRHELLPKNRNQVVYRADS